MGKSETEIVRRAYEVFDAADLDPLLALLDSEVDWISPDDAIEPGVRHGHAGVRKAYESTGNAFVDPVHELLGELVEGPNGTVLAHVAFRATGRGSGMKLDKPEWHVWTLRDGKAVRFAWFQQEAPALAEAGLS